MANRFHKLKGNDSEFPHIDNVHVYEFDNAFDYSRYNYTQMKLMLCTVPWDMGEAHIGNRTISGIGNVVYFGSKEKRNAWFDAIPDSECFRFETKYKELHRDLTIDVPIPYDVAAKFNYLKVHYSLFANDDSPVMYEDDTGHLDWFWFVREVEFVAPNTTRLHLLDDAFQTWIYDVDITGMVLERGHAPMFKTRAGAYLANPIDNSEYLLTEDVNFGDATRVVHTDVVALNSNNVYACIATTGQAMANWGSKSNESWHTPAATGYFNNGVPSVFVFAIAATNLDQFLSNVTQSYPQFKQTIQGIFFASTDLIAIRTQFDFAGIPCYEVESSRKTVDVTELGKGIFNYPEKYSDIAKLYTWPYAHIEVTDENGNIDIIKIEDTTGNIDASLSLSLAYPYITIEGHLLGVGGSNRQSISFRNVDSRTFDFGGSWYETLHEWKVPTFAVVLNAATEYDYDTYFLRKQAKIAYENAYASALDSANVARVNARNAADINKTNADNLANTSKTNADTSANAEQSIAKRNAGLVYANAVSNSNNIEQTAIHANKATQENTNEDLRYLSETTVENIQKMTGAGGDLEYDISYIRAASVIASEAISSNTWVNVAESAVSGAVNGAIVGFSGGGIGSVAGALGGAAISAATAQYSGQIQMTQNSDTAALNVWITNIRAVNAAGHMSRLSNQQEISIDTKNGIAKRLTTDTAKTNANTVLNQGTSAREVGNNNADELKTANNTIAANMLSTNITNNANTRQMLYDNADNTYNLSVANAGRTRDTAINDISNKMAQAALRAPFVYGSFTNGDHAVNKPLALFSNIVTQSSSAIASAGDEFLRYGYMLDRQWPFDGNWNIGKHFTYWKLKDFWVRNLNVPDMYMDKLRFFLFGGVTIWKKPEDIGNVTIYENFN